MRGTRFLYGVGSIGMLLAPASGGDTMFGAVLYFPIRRFIKPGVPDVDPFVAGEED